MKMIKKIMKRVLPERLYDSVRSLDNILKLAPKVTLNRGSVIKEDRNIYGKIVIYFLIQRTEVWSSLQTLFEATLKDERVDAYLIAIPKVKKYEIDYDDKANLEFCRAIASDRTFDFMEIQDKLWSDVHVFSPDYVITGVPYSNAYPAGFSMKEIAKHANLCYIPYGYTILKSDMQRTTCNIDVLSYVDYLFAESPVTFHYCRPIIRVSEFLFGKRLYDVGFPRFDLYKAFQVNRNMKIRTILWLPRWTLKSNVSSGNEPSSFFDLKDDILTYASFHPDIEVIIRPHPLAFDNYICSGEMTEKQVAEYKDRVKSIRNVCLDESPSYFDSLMKADVLIADFSSLLAEFFVTQKPIIYLGNGKNFAKEHIEMFNAFYSSKGWYDVEQLLDKLISGEDPKKEQRFKAVESFLRNKNFNTGKTILDKLLRDYESNMTNIGPTNRYSNKHRKLPH